MIKPNELQILMTALVFTPLMVWAYRGIERPQKRWLAAALIAQLGAYIATVAEGFILPVALNALEHVFYATAALCFVVASVSLLKIRTHLRTDGAK